jgi:hypothetical protein
MPLLIVCRTPKSPKGDISFVISLCFVIQSKYDNLELQSDSNKESGFGHSYWDNMIYMNNLT